jgi:hypothetical protein
MSYKKNNKAGIKVIIAAATITRKQKQQNNKVGGSKNEFFLSVTTVNVLNEGGCEGFDI